MPEKGGDWKNRQFSSILRGVFDLGAFSFGPVPPFVPSQNAVFDRELCSSEGPFVPQLAASREVQWASEPQ